MRRNLFVLAMLALQPALTTPTLAANLKTEFLTAWATRATKYATDLQAAQDRKNAAILALNAAAAAKSPDAQAKLVGMFDAAFYYGIAEGRQGVLNAFRAQFANKSSQAATEMWLQEQVSKLQDMSKQGDDNLKAVSLMKPGQDGLKPDDYMTKNLDAVAFNGVVRGASQESQLIDENLGTYFRAKTADDTERRQNRARIFGALGAALSGAASAPTAQPSLPVTVNCHTYYSGTVCTGR